jgi:hypothetical protein
MVPQRHLARMAPYHLPESLGGGVEVTAGGVQGGMAEQGLQLDHVSTGLQGGGGEGMAQSVHLGGSGDSTGETRLRGVGAGYWAEPAPLADTSAATSADGTLANAAERARGRASTTGRYRKEAVLRRKGNGSGLGERHGEPRQDRQVSVQRHPLDPPHPKGQQRPFVLQPAELPLHGTTAAVESLPPGRLSRDEGVQPICLDPHAARRALTGGAAVLGRTTLGVRTGERPYAVLARGGQPCRP